MNFQQLRAVRETIRRGFNLTEVAKVLHTSQPAISRQIRELEEELGFDLFVRAGKRLTGITEVGGVIVPIVETMLVDAENLKRAGEEYADRASGRLSIATTHSQARYALPDAVRDFRIRYPQVVLNLHQGSPHQVAEMLLAGEPMSASPTERWPRTTRWSRCRATAGPTASSCRGHPLLDGGRAHARVASRLSDHHPTAPATPASPHRRGVRRGRDRVRSGC